MLIIKTFCYLILQLTLLISVLFLLRGHNHPGGGFIGALVACAGFSFHSLAYNKLPTFIMNKSVLIICIGIVCLAVSMFFGLCFNKLLLKAVWVDVSFLGENFKLGTPLLFDVGVYFSIIGSLLWIIEGLEGNTDD